MTLPLKEEMMDVTKTDTNKSNRRTGVSRYYDKERI